MNSLNQLLQVICNTTDANERKTAEEKYFIFRKQNPSDQFVSEIIDIIVNSQQFSLLAVQFAIKDININKEQSIFNRVGDRLLLNNHIQQLLIQISKTQNEDLLQIVGHILTSNSSDTSQNQLVFQFIAQGYSSNIFEVQKLCLRLLSYVTISPELLFQQQCFDFITFLSVSLSNPQVSCHAIETICNFSVSIIKNEKYSLISEQQLKIMLDQVFSSIFTLQSEYQVLIVAEIFFTMISNIPDLFAPYLHQLEQFCFMMLQLTHNQDIINTSIQLLQNMLTEFEQYRNLNTLKSIISHLEGYFQYYLEDEDNTPDILCRQLLEAVLKEYQPQQISELLNEYLNQPEIYCTIIQQLNNDKQKVKLFLKDQMEKLLCIDCQTEYQIQMFLLAVANCFIVFDNKIQPYSNKLFARCSTYNNQVYIKELSLVSAQFLKVCIYTDEFFKFYQNIIMQSLQSDELFVKEQGFCILIGFSEGHFKNKLPPIYSQCYEIVFQSFFSIKDLLQDYQYIKNHQAFLSNVIHVVGDMIQHTDLLDEQKSTSIYDTLINLLDISLSIQNGEIFEAITESIIQLSNRYGNLVSTFGSILTSVLQNICETPAIKMSDVIANEGEIEFNDDVCQIQMNTMRLIVQILQVSPSQFVQQIRSVLVSLQKIQAVNSEMTEVQLQAIVMLINAAAMQSDVSVYDIVSTYLEFVGDLSGKQLSDVSSYVQGLEIAVKCYINYLQISKQTIDAQFTQLIYSKALETQQYLAQKQELSRDQIEIVTSQIGYLVISFLDLPDAGVAKQYVDAFLQQYGQLLPTTEIERALALETAKVIQHLTDVYAPGSVVEYLQFIEKFCINDFEFATVCIGAFAAATDRQIDVSSYLTYVHQILANIIQVQQSDEIEIDYDELIVDCCYFLEAYQQPQNPAILDLIVVEESDALNRLFMLVGSQKSTTDRYTQLVQKFWHVLPTSVQAIFETH